MELFKKYLYKTSLFSIVSEYTTYYLNLINEKPVSSVLAPITFTLLCYYIYVYIRKFYPVCVNCWFCNSNFNVAFEDRFEFTCIECGQFNGFKKDGSYSKTIFEQHEPKYNKTSFTMVQNDLKESKNGLCHRCNIIQEMKIKQLASFSPSKEKNFDSEIEKFKENLEASLKLCFKCNQYVQKILCLQEQRYGFKSFRINSQMGMQDFNQWPYLFSLWLSFIVFLLYSGAEPYIREWTATFVDISILSNSFIKKTHFVGVASLCGILCHAYCCFYMDKLSIVNMLPWTLLFTINNYGLWFYPNENWDTSKLFTSGFILLLSSVQVLRNLTKKQTIRQTSIQLEDENYQFPTTNYCDQSSNRSSKNSDESEMMDVDYLNESPKRVKKTSPKNVNNLFQGMRLSDGRGSRNNIIRPAKLFMPPKLSKVAGYAESSGYYACSVKDDFELDTQSIYSQHSYRPPYSPYAYYSSPHYYQTSPLNLSHSSNTSNIQHTTEWSKMLMYSIPGIVLLALQCYLLYDIKDFMKQK